MCHCMYDSLLVGGVDKLNSLELLETHLLYHNRTLKLKNNLQLNNKQCMYAYASLWVMVCHQRYESDRLWKEVLLLIWVLSKPWHHGWHCRMGERDSAATGGAGASHLHAFSRFRPKCWGCHQVPFPRLGAVWYKWH